MSVNVPISADINQGSFEAIRKGLVDIARQAGLSEKEIEDMNRQIDEGAKKSKKATQETQKGFSGLNKTVRSFGQGVAAAFSAQLVINFAKKVIEVTANFQKMEAVLTTALGSKSAAQVSMRMLSDFASKTPFQVDKLTESYVKLVNQGFKPSRQELTKLGDLASSTGKDFDQLTEAIIDAQVGEFERLKEFGIRASKEGDRVRFSFKGVQTEVENTEEAIRGYILSLGEAEGVTGSMAAVADTIGGKLSNLDDNFTQLMAVIGDGSSGLISGVLDLANNALGALSERLNAINQATKDDNGLIAFGKWISAMINPAYGAALELQSKVMEATAENQQKIADAAKETEKATTKVMTAAEKKAAEEAKRIANLGVIGKLEYEINQLQKERVNADTPAELALIDARIAKRRQEISFIEMLSKAIEAPGSGENPFATGIDSLAENFEKTKEESEKALDHFVEAYVAANEKAKQSDRELLQYKQELLYMAVDTAMFALDAYAQIVANNSQRQITAMEEEKNTRLQLAGEDAEQRLIIEENYNKKIGEMKRKAAIADKAASLFQIAINTAVGITETIKRWGMPFAVPFVALAVAQGAIQAGLVASQPLPKFAKGVFNLEGPGTGTSDSIHAMLSRGESVVPASKSAMFKDVVQPMIEDQHFNYEKLLGIALDKVDPRLRGDLFRTGKTQGGSGASYQKLEQIYQAIKSQKGTQVVIDKTGVSTEEKKRNRVIKQKTQFLYG